MPGTATALIIHPEQQNILFAAMQQYDGDEGGIFRSTDNGNTWELLLNGLPPQASFGFTSLSICKNFPDVLLAGIAKPYPGSDVGTLEGIYKSSNGGDSWFLINNDGFDFYCYPPPYDYICQGWYDNTVQISPVDTNTFFCGGIYLYKTTDGGESWDFTDNVPGFEGYMHPDHHSFAVDPGDEMRMFDFNDGGIYRTINGGASWKQINNGLVTTQFYYIASAQTDKNLVMGGTQDNGIWFNDDHQIDSVWVQYTYGDGFQCAIDHTDANIMYATELFQGRMKSTNGGNTFTEINDGLDETNYFITPIIMHPQNNQILFTATNNKIYRSVNAGESWVDVYDVLYIVMFCFDNANPDIIYACSDPYYNLSRLYISTDGGDTWSPCDEPGNKMSDIICDPFMEGTIYATRARYTLGQQVFKSTDYGETWQNISGDLPEIPANSLAVNAFNAEQLYIGTDIGVFISINGGENWTIFNDGLPNVIVKDIEYFAPDSTIRAGTHGRGFWQTKDPLIKNDSVINVYENEINIYPNPFINETTISFSLADAADVKLDIVDQLGQRIVLLVDDHLAAGSYSVNWNGRNENRAEVATGVYYVRFIYGGKAKSIKVIAG
ncbi:MAG: T9SS type A sorting domain-containing protein [Chitinophagales bacterium]